MIWQDLQIDRRLTEREIAAGMADAFGIALDSVCVVREGDRALQRRMGPEVALLATWVFGRGEFPLTVLIGLRSSAATEAVARPDDAAQMVARLARAWNARVLCDDGTGNPWTDRLVHPSGVTEIVELDGDALDRDEITLVVPTHVGVNRVRVEFAASAEGGHRAHAQVETDAVSLSG